MADNKNKKNTATGDDLTKFRINRVKDLKELYADELSNKRRQDQTPAYGGKIYNTAAEVRKALLDDISNPTNIVETSKKLYAVNPLYANIINALF